MSEITVYGLKNCDKCREAARALDAADRPYDFVDIRADAGLQALLPRWIEALGAEALINKKSRTWRELSDEERAQAETDPAGLLADRPTLIKRPVIESADVIASGWTGNVRASLGLG